MELYLFDTTTRNYLVGNVHFGSFGNLREVRFSTNLGFSDAQTINQTLVYERWYRIRIQADASSAAMYFYDDATNALLWQSSVFPVGLANLGAAFHICFAQYLHTPGPGSWIAHAALDRIEAGSGATPVEPSTWGQVKNTFIR